MHKVHAGYTLLVPLRADCVDAAAALLAELDRHPERLPFEASKTTHFATVTIVPAQTYGDEQLPATLLFATSFCGPARDHIAELVSLMGAELCVLFGHCEGFDAAHLERFILENRHGDTFYSGMQNLSPEDVHRHHELRTEIETFIDHQQEIGGLADNPLGVRRQIQKHIRSQPRFDWAQRPFDLAPGTWMALHWRTLILGAIAVPPLAALVLCTFGLVFCHGATLTSVVERGWLGFAVVLACLVALVLAIRVDEYEQSYVAGRQSDKLVRELAATQNRPVINEMTVAGPIKEGWLRPIVLRMALWAVARLAEGIPGLREPIVIPTVATARWIAADRGRRLIFISNYTNAAEGYVRDFIDTEAGARNINLSFGFGRGYPKTRWIIRDGALRDPNAFGYVVTANQHRTAFWYGRYADISIDNITINRKIREGLFANLDDDKAKEWVHLL